ncbi:hypothetical protein, partial [Paraclostridium dentum]|uniref:hypothetical protein n=1 Tax=Paraclostridium dentum TaxID=2662455 RepID=UPI001D009FF4
ARALSVVLSLFLLRGPVTRLLAAALVVTTLSFTFSDLSCLLPLKNPGGILSHLNLAWGIIRPQ